MSKNTVHKIEEWEEKIASLKEELAKLREQLTDAEMRGFEKHKLSVVTMFRMKAAGLDNQTLRDCMNQWADMIAEIAPSSVEDKEARP